MTNTVCEPCPNCKAEIEFIFNPENIAGNTVSICSTCRALICVEKGKFRKMSLPEVLTQYEILKKMYSDVQTDTLLVKLVWVKKAISNLRKELAVLN